MSSPHSARRRFGVVAVVGIAAVAGATLVPLTAQAADDPDSRNADFSVADGWTGDVVANPGNYDFQVNPDGKLRASNWAVINDPGTTQRNNINQLLAPTVTPAGEPFYTSATHDQFTATFTVDSALTGADPYIAQPKLALEVDADNNGNRAGGGITLRVPADHVLEISNYYSTPSDLGAIWRNSVVDVPFTGPLTIEYSVLFKAAGNDVATVKVDGVNKLTGGTFEGYSLGVNGAAQTVNSVLFREVARQPGAAVGPTSWTNDYPTDDENAALRYTGFLFSDLSYSTSATAAEGGQFPHDSIQTVEALNVKSYEDASTYNDWHVTRGDSVAGDINDPGTSAWNIDADNNLNLVDPLMNGHSVQFLKGIPTADQPNSVRDLVNAGIVWLQPVGATGTAYFQLPIYIDGAWGGTLRPADPHLGGNIVQPADQWVLSKSIGSEYTANTPVALSALLDILDGHTVKVIGFGIASSGADATTAITEIYFNHTKYVFANDPALVFTPTISGVAQVGQTLTAHVSSAVSGSTYGYQWQRDGVDIPSATTGTYALVAADLAKHITVAVTGSHTGYVGGTTVSDPTGVVIPGTINITTPTISGTARVGATLTAAATPDVSGVTLQYTWYRDDVVIPGAGSASYTLDAADLGHQISVKVTPSRLGYSGASKTSAKTATVVVGTIIITPTITGTAKVGQVLTASTISNVTPVTYHYQWYRDAAAISGAVGATYTLAVADLGHKISVKVTASRAGFVGVTTYSAKTATVGLGTITTLGLPTISGIVKVGQKLTVVKPTFTPAGATFTYRWYRNNVTIAGASAASYTLTPTDLNKTIRVRVQAAKVGYTAFGVTSAASAPVGLGIITVSKVPTITGITRVGYTLTAHTTGWNTTGLQLKYSWYANGDLIQLSTTPTLKLTAEQKGMAITVSVRGWKVAYAPTQSLVSHATATIH